jgi:hypothetical protein
MRGGWVPEIKKALEDQLCNGA